MTPEVSGQGETHERDEAARLADLQFSDHEMAVMAAANMLLTLPLDGDVMVRARALITAGWRSPADAARLVAEARKDGIREGREQAAQAIEAARSSNDENIRWPQALESWRAYCARLARGEQP